MSRRGISLTLLLPGLLGPRSDNATSAAPRTPALLRLLSRARHRRSSTPDFETRLCRLFDPEIDSPPVAALTRLADGGNPDDHWWLRADPVHLQADLHRVRLTEARSLVITPDQAHALGTSFNETFATDGLRLETPHPQRWYLRVNRPPALETTPLPAVIGRNITPFLPEGHDRRYWRTLLTECQMLFHEHPVNQAREQTGLAPINGIWLWGGGKVPTMTRPEFALYANDPLSRGLARRADLAVQPLPENALDWYEAADDESSGLIVFEALRDPVADDDITAWHTHLETLEHDWFRPLDRLIRTGRLAELHLLTDSGDEWRIGRRDLARFWRRSRALDYWRTR